ncbi:methyltransferase domain-containing protein [uncultured Tateyamaria sp.]|uniref:class I SAM-dependent methyltransferase n=1 Tax=uncultured Tateyamaria sp. TaxID=455651 RepID=UPI00260784CB|nr:methyltransferase domain-containing protein [uncultured Tateyamaria sp.]
MLRLLPRFDRPRSAAQSGALQAIYDAAATGWQDGISRLGFIDAYAQLMRSAPSPTTPPTVLDVGTGTGAFAQAWIDAHGTPAALALTDISPAMLQVAATRLPVTQALAIGVGDEVAHLPPQDIVLCAHVIEHLDDPHAALAWLRDQLRPGGTLIMAISKPHWCTALVRWRWGNAAYTPDQAHAMLTAAGFTAITARAFTGGPPSRVSHGYIAQRA